MLPSGDQCKRYKKKNHGMYVPREANKEMNVKAIKRACIKTSVAWAADTWKGVRLPPALLFVFLFIAAV